VNKYQKEVLDAALGYAKRGWRVLPVAKQSKKPINENGSTGATTDAATITKWWETYPSANLGIATGPESFWVVDVDMKDGTDGLQTLARHFGDDFDIDINAVLVGKTPTDGVHIPFQWPDGDDVHNSQALLPGIDIRGRGGYIVAAPSARNIDGQWLQYRWNNINLPVGRVAPWAAKLLKMQDEVRSERLDVEQVMRGVSKGERDTALFRYACHLRALDMPYELAVGFIKEAAARCEPPFDQAVAVQKVDYAYREFEPRSDRKQDLSTTAKMLLEGEQ
jgi:hypothetical protein